MVLVDGRGGGGWNVRRVKAVKCGYGVQTVVGCEVLSAAGGQVGRQWAHAGYQISLLENQISHTGSTSANLRT